MGGKRERTMTTTTLTRTFNRVFDPKGAQTYLTVRRAPGREKAQPGGAYRWNHSNPKKPVILSERFVTAKPTGEAGSESKNPPKFSATPQERR